MLLLLLLAVIVVVDPRNHLESLVKIRSVTAEVLLMLSSRWVVGGGVKSFSCHTQPLS